MKKLNLLYIIISTIFLIANLSKINYCLAPPGYINQISFYFFFKSARDLFGEDISKYFQENDVGTEAALDKPAKNYRRFLDDNLLKNAALLLNEIGLGFLLNTNIAYIRTNINSDKHKIYMVRNLMLGIKQGNRRIIKQAILIPDFPEDLVQFILDESLSDVYPEDLLKQTWIRTAIENNLPSDYVDYLYTIIRTLPTSSLPIRNENTLKRIMHLGIFHEFAEGLWETLEAKVFVENNQRAKDLFEWWSNNYYKFSKGVILVKNSAKLALNPKDNIIENFFADKFSMFVDANSIFYEFHETLSDEEKEFFKQVVEFFQEEHKKHGNALSIRRDHYNKASQESARSN